jgi:predicted nucleic acid-binding protein
MSATVFVDTNILVYARDTGDPRKQATAEEWLRRLWVEQRGRTSMQVLSEYYTTVTHKLKPGLEPADAWEDVTALLAWEPQPIDGTALARGYALSQRYKLSWWDSLIVAAAELQRCDILLSEDLQHGAKIEGVTIQNPFATGVAEQQAEYASTPQRTSRHRTRGRPPRSQQRAVAT